MEMTIRVSFLLGHLVKLASGSSLPIEEAAYRWVEFLRGLFLWFMGLLEFLFHSNFFLIPSYILSP